MRVNECYRSQSHGNMAEATPTFARVVEAFRAMEPVADVLDILRSAAGGGEQWLSLAYQVRSVAFLLLSMVRVR